MHITRQVALIVFCLLCGAAGGASVGKTMTQKVEVLLSTSETIIGGPITYPDGRAQITAAIVTLEPGQQTGWHRHNVPLFAYVIEGELSIDYGDHGIHQFSAGDAFVEAMDVEHNGMTAGRGSARVLAVFAGAESVPNTTVGSE